MRFSSGLNQYSTGPFTLLSYTSTSSGMTSFSRRWPMMASLRMMTGVMYLSASSKAFIVKSKDSCTEEGQIAMTS